MKIAAILSVAVFVAGAVLVNILDNALVAVAMGIVSGSAASLPIALRMRQTTGQAAHVTNVLEDEDDDDETAIVLAA
jgi:hypothetical protein